MIVTRLGLLEGVELKPGDKLVLEVERVERTAAGTTVTGATARLTPKEDRT